MSVIKITIKKDVDRCSPELRDEGMLLKLSWPAFKRSRAMLMVARKKI